MPGSVEPRAGFAKGQTHRPSRWTRPGSWSEKDAGDQVQDHLRPCRSYWEARGNFCGCRIAGGG